MNEVKEINKPATKRVLKPLFGHVVAPDLGYVQTDLLDLSTYKNQGNRNYSYGLVLIDIFSRYGWVFPIKHKTASDVRDALKTWIESHPFRSKKIRTLFSDDGGEFKGSVQTLLSQNHIKQVRVNADITHQVLAERWIRTLKEKIRDKWQENHNFNWIDVINQIVDTYNNTRHSGIRATPTYVLNGKETPVQNTNQFDERNALDVGDNVRILVKKEKFDKPSLTGNYSERVFRVQSRFGNNYTLSNGETYPRWRLLLSSFVPEEERKPLAVKQKVIKKEKAVKALLNREDIQSNRIQTRSRAWKPSFLGLVRFE
jgi:hypothetical protein